MTSRPAVAVLGMGTIGSPVARNLDAAGYPVRVWNRTIEKAKDAAAGSRITVCDTPRDAVTGADIVVTVLTDARTTEAVMDRAAAGVRPGLLWLQMGTVGAAITGLSHWASRHGVTLVDAPVQGSRQPAEEGKLVVIASGPDSAHVAAQPVFDAIGSRTLWVGDAPGTASRLKLALNVWVAALTHGVAESLAVARSLGVAPELVVDVVSGGPMDSGFFQAKAAAVLNNDYDASFTVANAVKDTELVLDAVRDAVPADLSRAALRRWSLAAEQGHRDKDMIASHLAQSQPQTTL